MSLADKKRLLRSMLYARRFEERCYEAYVEKKIIGFLHPYFGQETCAHGLMEAATPGSDYVISGYRDHVHAIFDLGGQNNDHSAFSCPPGGASVCPYPYSRRWRLQFNQTTNENDHFAEANSLTGLNFFH